MAPFYLLICWSSGSVLSRTLNWRRRPAWRLSNGIITDSATLTADPAVYAIGDCANHYNALLNRQDTAGIVAKCDRAGSYLRSFNLRKTV